MPAHHVALADVDAGDGRAEPQTLLRVEGESPQLLDFLDVDQMPGAADSGAQLDEDVGAAAERARILAVSLEDADRLIECAWGFVIYRVQGKKPPGRVKIIPALLTWIAYLPGPEKGPTRVRSRHAARLRGWTSRSIFGASSSL